MENEILIALIGKMVDERLAQLPALAGARGPRGFPGHDGKDFVFSEHEEAIRAWAEEFALEFEDLSNDQIESLRGPRGRDGSNGIDGRSFSYEENRDAIEATIRDVVSGLRASLKLRFADLTKEEVGEIRGPRGRDGRDGRDFDFEENKNAIEESIGRTVGAHREDLRLKFSDLSGEEVSQLRGPRGRDGSDGRNFVFDDHRDFFEGLRLKFSDLTEEERESLKLHFSQLTEGEKSSLKLRFEDLTDEDRALIKGPRGLRGQRGSQGRDGENGKQGPRGVPGLRGFAGQNGLAGRDGSDGVNGADAPYITSIDIEQFRGEIIFRFEFSDGTIIRTDPVELPASSVTVAGGGGRRKKVEYDVRVDEPDSVTTYVGETVPGTATSEPAWRIKRMSIVGSETVIEYADGRPELIHVWDDRSGLSYA